MTQRLQVWTREEADKQWAMAHWIDTDEGFEFLYSCSNTIPNDEHLWLIMLGWQKMKEKECE